MTTETDNKAGEPAEALVIPLWPDAAKLLNLGRNAAYDAAARGEIPTLRFGRKIVVPRAPLMKLVGVD